MSKRERPISFFEEEEDDLDYLINQSIEHDQENEFMSYDEYMNQSSTTKTDNDIFQQELNNDLLFENNNGFEYPSSPPPHQSVIAAMDYMDLSDNEIETIEHVVIKPKKPVKKVDYTKIPETGGFINAVCPVTGKDLYFSKRTRAESKRKMEELFKNILSDKGHRRTLLSKPVWQLRKDIEKTNQEELKRIEKEIEDENARKNKKKRLIPKDNSGQLWVDKYRPQTYMDLMGDQRLNRDVLRWVKQWDYCVFKKKPPQESQRDQQIRQYRNTFGTPPKFAAYKKENEKSNDPLLRPDKRILLMSGPPGFGKTTLAHVIAKQAGYNIIEINASDDRTGEVVKSKIKSALEMQAIMREANTKDGKRTMLMTQKPNLLIIDEIDGASSGGGTDSFIKQLVQLAVAEPNTDKNKKGKKKGETPLLRPIICICNDPYAPVLRPLRMIAKSVQFRKVPMMSIAKRLQDICDSEGLESDLRTLSLLSETTDGDIRSCLNTLQFVRGKSTTFTKDMLEQAGLGKKDMSKSLFSVWEDLFTAPNARHKTSLNKDDFDNNKYVDRLYHDIMSNGEIERVMQGCFESYPLMRFHDVAFQKVCQINDWFSFYDQINHRANEKHEYDVYKYLPYPIVNFHRFFAGTTFQDHKVEYPRIEYEIFSTKKSFENLIDIFLAGIHSQKRRYLTKDMIANELVPLLMHIITPDLKPVNQQLIKPAEKAKLARLVDIMIEFGLSFIQEKNEDGQFTFKLEPPVEQLLQFDLSSPKAILPRQYAVRQMIAHEIETEILRRREESLKTRNKGKPVIETPTIKTKIAKEQQSSIDFFGRKVVANPEKEKVTKSFKMEVDTPTTSVNYKYHEGFSNAVRKPMTVKMFL